MRILIVEDNHRLSHELRQSLMYEGYAVDVAYDGDAGLAFAESAPYDAMILDVLLPIQDGLEVCHTLRQRGCTIPILMLTARDALDDRVRGLDSGADDYLVKPFALTELLARLRALLRRGGPQKSPVLCVGDLTVDPATHTVKRGSAQIELTAMLFTLLEYFMRHPDHILSHDRIADHIWSYDTPGTPNAIEVYIRRLRRKIDDPFEVKLLETVRGAGYRLRTPKTPEEKGR
jgi:DNA-binding response OmpR family regulator